MRIYFEHTLFHRFPHSSQAITRTNQIWPDLSFGFVNKRSGYEIIESVRIRSLCFKMMILASACSHIPAYNELVLLVM